MLYIVCIYMSGKGNPAGKRKRDRPNGPGPSSTRSEAILVRVTGREKERLARASRRSGLGVSTMLRTLGLQHATQTEKR